MRLFTKPSAVYSRRYPYVVRAINRLRVTSIVMDGEAVCVGSDGLADFDPLCNRTNDASVLFFAFDLLGLDGEDLRPKPLLKRKRRPAKLLGKDASAFVTSSIWKVIDRCTAERGRARRNTD